MTFKWGGYPRISEDPKDLRTGLTRQVEDITAGVVRQGGSAADIKWYPENDTSAYKKRKVELVDPLGNAYSGYRVIRPVWHKALHDLRTGVIDGLMVWDLDRLARDPRDLEDAIEVVTYFHKRIEDTMPGGVELSTDNGIVMARVFVVMGNKSSADTARRVARMHKGLADKGRPVGGRRTFGWLPDKSTLDVAEAVLARRAVADVMEGRNLTSICNEWNAAGVRTVMGNDWNASKLRQYLLNPRLAGVRTLKGKPVEGGQAGQWEPLISQAEFDQLRAMMTVPEVRSRVPRRGARHYLLTGLITCGVCAGPMYGNKHKTGFNYVCNEKHPHPHSISASGLTVDRMVEKVFLAHVQDVEPADTDEQWVGETELTDAKGQVADLMAAFKSKQLSAAVAFPAIQELEEQVAELQHERSEWLAATAGPTLSRYTLEEWADKTTDEKRVHLEKVLSAVVVRPGERHANRFDVERLVPVWREAKQALPVAVE